MRKLILLQGASAVGKSTWIKNHNLEDYVVSADTIRKGLGYNTVTMIDEKITPIMDSQQERPVWDVFNQMLEKRMYDGITTIIDNTNTNFMALKPLRKLAKKYNYDVMTIDFMAENSYKDASAIFEAKKSDFVKQNPDFELEPDLSATGGKRLTDLLMTHNEHRDSFVVPDSIIRRQVDQYKELWRKIKADPTDWKWLNQALPDSDKQRMFLKHDKVIDLNKYKKVQVIGDIHNDFSALMKVFDEHEKGTAYIFLGDYLDKGTRPYSTFEFIAEELQGTNLFFLRGNHEDLWARWLYTGKVSPQFEKSLNILLKQYGEEKLRELMTSFLSQMKDYMIFRYNGHLFLASHAGFEPQMLINETNLNLLPSKAFTYGLSTGFDVHNPYARDIDALWKKAGISDYNLHGHRNNFNRFVEGTSINLNYEGQFRWLTITRDGMKAKKIKSIDAPSFENALKDDPDIYTKNQSDGITSYNFTPKAFIQQRWNQHTINARGLFIRQSDRRIVGRGFPKFFEIGQVPTAQLQYLQFPVTVMRKHDGFLTITCYDEKTKKIHVYSKAGETEMADLAKNDLIKSGYMDKIEKYYQDENVRDTSLLFEVVDPTHDMHIVKYAQLHIYPIAIIANDRQGMWLSEKPDKKHAKNLTFNNWCISEINAKSWITTVDAIDDSMQARHDAVERLQHMIDHDQQENPHREGVVLYGQNMMLKVKSPFYHKAEELRQQLDFYALKGGLKSRWHYGARDWARFCVDMHELDYTPDLPLMLEKFDQKYNIHEILLAINKSNKDAYINHEALNNARRIWQKFKEDYDK